MIVENMRKFLDNLRNRFPDQCKITMFYIGGGILFSVCLYFYNKTLSGKSAIEVMFDNRGLSWVFLIIAMLALVIGVWIINTFWQLRKYDLEIEEYGMLGFLAILIIIMIVVIGVLINNPIFTSAVFVVSALTVLTSQS